MTTEGPRALHDCWCGSGGSTPFSEHYVACDACGTLRTIELPSAEALDVGEEDTGLYGKSYWLSRQAEVYGYPDIHSRARSDFCDRIPQWLANQLKYALPPGRALELGAAHGGYVGLMRWAGFDAMGLEMSPAIAGLARETFGVPMLTGRVEEQALEPGSFDVIALMDVLEHLPDPAATMKHCASLLSPDGILIVQTPRYAEGKTLEEMRATEDPFPVQLKEEEHLFLFTERAARQLFDGIGLPWVVTEPAPFPYDMFLVCGRRSREPHSEEQILAALQDVPTGRLVLAVLDLSDRLRGSEADRQARLEAIEYLKARLEQR